MVVGWGGGWQIVRSYFNATDDESADALAFVNRLLNDGKTGDQAKEQKAKGKEEKEKESKTTKQKREPPSPRDKPGRDKRRRSLNKWSLAANKTGGYTLPAYYSVFENIL